MKVGGVDVRWAPKLRPEKLRRLYELDAQGLADEELIDEVGYTLYSRCESILTVTESFGGRVRCPGCGAVILRQAGTGPTEETLRCDHCAWQATWREYHQSWQNRQLWGGNAVEAFQEFVHRFPAAHEPRQKLVLIDQLIHAYHYDLRRQVHNRPAAANLIEGGLRQVIQFLDALTYGSQSTPGLERAQAEWREITEASRARLSHAEQNRQGLQRQRTGGAADAQGSGSIVTQP